MCNFKSVRASGMQEDELHRVAFARAKLRRTFEAWRAIASHLHESRNELSEVVEKVCSPSAVDILENWQAAAKENARLRRIADAIEGKRSSAQKQSALKVRSASHIDLNKLVHLLIQWLVSNHVF